MRDAYVQTVEGTRVHCLLAETLEQRTVGLSQARHVPVGGMLFDFGTPQIASMTMHETQIPLAMIFIDNDGIVVHVVRRAVPGDVMPYVAPMPVRWVLETAPETVDRLRAHPGMTLIPYLPLGRIAA
jgi:uncharacterized protein